MPENNKIVSSQIDPTDGQRKPATEQDPPASSTTFQIQRLYVKERSMKVPYAPGIFQRTEAPENTMEMGVKHTSLPDSTYEVVLQISVTAKVEQQTAFHLDIQQAGLFKLDGFEPAQHKQLLEAYCPNLLYPYARKVISDMTLEASFPPLTLAPVNFDALYQQSQTQAAQKEQDAPQDKEAPVGGESTHPAAVEV